MAQQKGLMKVSSSGKGFANLTANGKQITLTFSEKVSNFFPDGLKEGRDYWVEYDDEDEQIKYAKLQDTENTQTQKSDDKPSRQDKDETILKQVCLKVASHQTADEEETKRLAKAYKKFLKERWED